MHIVIIALSLSKYLCSKRIQYEDSHVFPRIQTAWSHRYVKSKVPSLFDSLGTLTLVTIGHESSKSVYFSSFSGLKLFSI